MATIEELLDLSLGARWLKADLHVHTPASNDIADEWRNCGPNDLVKAAINKGLDIIAITDHNTGSFCDGAQEAAKGTSVTVLPGVEISTSQGHVLAVFEVGTSSKEIEDLLVRLDIPRKEFGSLEAATKGGIAEVSSAIGAAGGVAIAAHIDAEKGFWKTIKVGAEKKRAFCADNLWALEVVNPSFRDEAQKGAVPGYQRRIACIQSSDCPSLTGGGHDFNQMGCRYTMLKMDERSLSGLKLALIDPEIRVRLHNDGCASPSCAIEGMWVTGGFLDDLRLRFNENVNCLIGDTGAGKSVAIELLRFALDQGPVVQKIRDEVAQLLRQQLGSLGVVHVVLRKADATYLIERAWGEPPADPTVQRLSPAGLDPVDGPLSIPSFFRVKAFSQSEIIEFARQPAVRLSLTDDLIDSSQEMAAIEDLKVRLRRNAADILSQRAKVELIQEEVGKLPTLQQARAEVDRVLTDGRITQHHLWYKEQSILDQAVTDFDAMLSKVGETVSSLRTSALELDELSEMPNLDLLEELTAIRTAWDEKVTRSQDELLTTLRDLISKLGDLHQRWKSKFDAAEECYEKLLASIDEHGAGLAALSKRKQKLETEITKLQDRKRELDTQVIPQSLALEQDREKLLTELQSNRNSITAKRESKAKDLSEVLAHRIRLRVHQRANTNKLRLGLQMIYPGSRLRTEDLDALARCHPVPLVKLLLANDFNGLYELSGVEQGKLTRLWDTIQERDRLGDLYELQIADVDDVIDVMLEVAQGKYRPLEELAHGQKCMVVLMVALAEGEFPLLVDQPEDALHAPSIEEGIVSTLRSHRGSRQCIFATRNANILVSADAEQIIALQADAMHGKVNSTGSLDRFNQRHLVVYHVEGGEEAFRRRQTKYSLRPLV